jgi:hypothetical protein
MKKTTYRYFPCNRLTQTGLGGYSLLLLFLILFSCNSTIDAEWDYKRFKRRLDPVLEGLEEKYPNYKDNSIVREKARAELEKMTDTLLNLKYISQIPLKVLRLGRTPDGLGAMVHFYTDNYDYKIDRLSDRFNFDVIGFMSENLASYIKEDSKYYVYASDYQLLTKKQAFELVNQVYYTPEIAINKGIGNDFLFNIGNMRCRVDSVKLVGRYDIPK